ncbi:GNAT family N-acetyltransferase [Streptomyces hoynatensis]|uniref:GNAT family N-acetyltransferase n=1 Tax=Streptomyces hoynatensis TaxID=1141874 RepID=A0A3A9Z4Q1_9ACTN|nr:GNAT family N-acetyltransferase [Streptomyces hoynatensis]RKN43190.1 GNAT family N-acetyltransferase [Streptomyces hoynatensis]
MAPPTPDLGALPVRRLGPEDLTACLDLADDRGWGREEHKWRLLLSAGQGYGVAAPPGDPHGGLIATVVATPYGADYRCLSMVLVARRHGRRGLGRRLMRHVLAECGTAAAFLTATELGRPLYEELGFKPVGALTTLRGAFTGAQPPGALPAGAVVRPATAADLPDILAYDLPIFGADRTGLLARLPSFAAQLLVARAADGSLTGFAASWPNPTSTVVGPLLAEDEPTARQLLAALARQAPPPLRFDADDRHPGLAAWLRANGLGDSSRCTLMVLGAPDIPGDVSRRFAPYSVALG